MAVDKLKNLLNVDIKDGLPGNAVVQSSSVPTEAGKHPWVEDRIGKLERLAKLRDSGVLSEAEFEAEETRILAG